MNTYNVLMTIQQYIEVKANSAQEASMTAWEEYRQGKHEVDAYPEFTCDEYDIVEDEVDE
jgi:uncharacterized protein YbgA (DUF1722 family)